MALLIIKEYLLRKEYGRSRIKIDKQPRKNNIE